MSPICRKLIILLTGMPGSGKSIFSAKAREKGFAVISLGDVVREEARRRGMELSSKNVMELAKELRRAYGRDAVAKLALNRIEMALSLNPIVVVDGVRNLDEVIFVRKNVTADVITVAIHASPKTRFERLLKRGRSDDPKDWESFIKRDLEEISLGVAEVIALSDYMFVNEGSIQEFYSSIENFLDTVLRKWCT